MFGFFKKKDGDGSAEQKAGRLHHIAFIMDGNGRWAEKRGMPRTYGHAAGAANFRKITEYCGDIGINAVTLYALSTENVQNRPKAELDAIMKLFGEYMDEAEKTCGKKNIQLHFLGDRTIFPEKTQLRMDNVEKSTAGNGRILNIAVNYGGRAEIVRAANILLSQGESVITEDGISKNLYTVSSPPVDLIVRTGAEKRISNFLLWQAAYAELYFSDVLWPDFSERDVDAAVKEFNRRKRRYGGL